MNETIVSQQESESKNNAVAYYEPWNKSTDDWVNILEKDVGDFEGNKQYAAQILFEIARGMKIVTDKLEAKGLKYDPPRLGILHGRGNENTSIVHDQENDCVIVSKRFLQNLAQFDPSQLYAFRRDDGEITFKGSVGNLVRNFGVEEAHHSAFYQYKQKKIPWIDALSMPMNEYDSSDHEYRALIWQKRVAQEEGDPQITVEHLSQRVEEAKKERLKRLAFSKSPRKNTD